MKPCKGCKMPMACKKAGKCLMAEAKKMKGKKGKGKGAY